MKPCILTVTQIVLDISVQYTPAGGNIDDKRLTSGSTLYLPVEVAGALLMAGDGHAAMGDAELSGTGIEVSLNSKLRLVLVLGCSTNSCCTCTLASQRLTTATQKLETVLRCSIF